MSDGGSDPQAVQQQATANQPWFRGEGFDEDLSKFTEGQGWKSPAAAAKSYQELYKFHRTPEARRMVLPEREDDADGWGRVHARLGRPETPEGYGFAAPKDGQIDLREIAGKRFHEAGLSTSQAKVMGEILATAQEQHAQVSRADEERALAAGQVALRSRWGKDYDRNLDLSRQALRAGAEGAGYEDKAELEEDLAAIETALISKRGAQGYERFMRMFHVFGSKMGEQSFAGEGASGPMRLGGGVQESREEIARLKLDRAFIAAFMDEGHHGHRAAIKKWADLHRVAGSD